MIDTDFRKVGTAYRMRVDTGSVLWIKRHQRSRRYELIHEYRDPTGARRWATLASHGSIHAAARDAHALTATPFLAASKETP